MNGGRHASHAGTRRRSAADRHGDARRCLAPANRPCYDDRAGRVRANAAPHTAPHAGPSRQRSHRAERAAPPQSAARPAMSGSADLPPAARLPGVTHIWQTWNNCGPATLAMYLSHFGQQVKQDEVGAQLRPDPDDKNVSLEEMAAYARSRGLSATACERRYVAAAPADPRRGAGADRDVAPGSAQRWHGPLSLADRL